jgi:hypothetical protein
LACEIVGSGGHDLADGTVADRAPSGAAAAAVDQ